MVVRRIQTIRINALCVSCYQTHLLQRSAGCSDFLPFHLHRGLSFHNFLFHLKGAAGLLLCPSRFFARFIKYIMKIAMKAYKESVTFSSIAGGLVGRWAATLDSATRTTPAPASRAVEVQQASSVTRQACLHPTYKKTTNITPRKA